MTRTRQRQPSTAHEHAIRYASDSEKRQRCRHVKDCREPVRYRVSFWYFQKLDRAPVLWTRLLCEEAGQRFSKRYEVEIENPAGFFTPQDVRRNKRRRTGLMFMAAAVIVCLVLFELINQ